MASTRVYRGIQGSDRQAERRSRLLEAGLDLLTSGPATTVTIRGVCKQAGVVARYFYESFHDLDEFVVAVYDGVIGRLAKTTQDAVNSVPVPQKTRTGIDNILRVVDGDPRIGRLLFSGNPINAVLAQRRNAAGELFATLSGQYLRDTYHFSENDFMRAAAYFAVGGVNQTLAAWVSGQLKLGIDELGDTLTKLLEQQITR